MPQAHDVFKFLEQGVWVPFLHPWRSNTPHAFALDRKSLEKWTSLKRKRLSAFFRGRAFTFALFPHVPRNEEARAVCAACSFFDTAVWFFLTDTGILLSSVQGTEPEKTFTHLGTHRTGLQDILYTRLVVMPSGKVVVFNDGGFHIYKGSPTEWTKLKQLLRLCEDHANHMSPVTTGNQELLAVSCWLCEVIRLLNLETGECSTAFRDPRYKPYEICEGEEGQMFVSCRDDWVILLLECCSQNFNVVTSFNLNSESDRIQYVPQHKLVVSVSGETVWGHDCGSGKLQWKRTFGYVHQVGYSLEHDAVFLCHRSGKVMELNASDGELRQELRLPGEVDWVWGMRLHDGQLVVLYGYPELKVSFFSLQ